MRSNIKAISNVYIRKGELLDDLEYVKRVKGEKSLWQLLEKLGVSIENAREKGLTEKQIMELNSSSRCLINDPYNGSYGLTIKEGKEVIEFRCLNTECEVYDECLQIEKPQEAILTEDPKEDSKEVKEEDILVSNSEGEKVEKLSKEVDSILSEINSLYTKLETIRKELKEK
jgi:hypothetical protein